MKKSIALLAVSVLLAGGPVAMAQDVKSAETAAAAVADTAATVAEDSIAGNEYEEALEEESEGLDAEAAESIGIHRTLKTKFVEGTAGFMSLVAVALVLGLAFCIERIIYLTLSEINAKRLMEDISRHVEAGDIERAKDLCRDTRGPVASICYQGLLRISDTMENIERSIISYGSVQSANLERGCSWITLFISIAPSLGFLGTVIGMVMAFDQIRLAGDINATIVASGMKVALITTIFGIIVAIVLQLFYNYILSKIEHLTSQMEESAISLMDMIMKYKLTHDDSTPEK